MGLVDYSDSESDSEPVTKPAPAAPSQPAAQPTTSGKKPFQKVVDRSKPGKILVNLPQTSSNRDESKATDGGDAPPAKRARIAGRGGGAFSGFNSFLPPPKNVGKPTVASGSGKPAPRPGVNLKTGATPGFSRDVDGNAEAGLGETAPKNEDAEVSTKQPSIPAEQKPAEEVKLVGKPLMFKPLSVSRKPGKKSTAKSTAASRSGTTTPVTATPQPSSESQTKEGENTGPPAKKQKISLFSISNEPAADEAEEPPTNNNGVYEPMFSTSDTSMTDDFAAYDAQYAATHTPDPSLTSSSAPPGPSTSTPHADTLDALADSMNLSAAARRELFGRGGDAAAAAGSARVVRFDTDREYARNEQLRASGQLQPAYNPVRSVAPAGKHSLRQLVTQVQSNREALEESFAKGRSGRREAGSKYGWR